MKLLTAISREELVQALERSRQGEDLGRRLLARENLMAEYFRERSMLTARVRELLARRERKTCDD
jgi:hypothetical protein